jgi:hypothetical protein
LVGSSGLDGVGWFLGGQKSTIYRVGHQKIEFF